MLYPSLATLDSIPFVSFSSPSVIVGNERMSGSRFLSLVLFFGLMGVLHITACSSPRVSSCTHVGECPNGWQCIQQICLDCTIHNCQANTAQEHNAPQDGPSSEGSPQEQDSPDTTDVANTTDGSVSDTQIPQDSLSESSPDSGQDGSTSQEETNSELGEPSSDAMPEHSPESIQPESTPEPPLTPQKICAPPPPLPQKPVPSHLFQQFHTHSYTYVSSTPNPIMDISPDGTWVAVGSFVSGLVQLWKWTTDRYVFHQTLWTEHTEGLRSIRFGKDGKALATGGVDMAIRVWRTSDWKMTHLLEQHTSAVYDLDFSPDGKSLLSAGYYDYRIRHWDLTTGLQLNSFYNYRGDTSSGSYAVFAVAFSPDGKTFATGSNDNFVKIWSFGTGKVEHAMSGHSSHIWSVAYSPDGKLLVSAGNDRVARVWDTATGTLITTLNNPMTTSDGYVYSAAFSKDGKQIILSGGSDQRIYFWDVEKKDYVYKSTALLHSSSVYTVRFHPSGTMALSVGFDQYLRVWNLGTTPALRSAHDIGADPLYRWIQHPNGKQVWVCSANEPDIGLWDLSQNKQIQRWTGHTQGVRALALSPDKQWLVSASSDRSLRIWNVSTGKLTKTIDQAHTLPINHLTFRPGGTPWFASAGDDGAVKLWDISTGTLLHTLTGITGRVMETAFTTTGDILLAVGEDKLPRYWAMADLKQPAKTLSGHTDRVLTIAVDPKGQTIATGSMDRRIRIWKASDFSLALEINNHLGAIRALAFSPDGKWLASASYDRTIKIWDVATGNRLQTLSQHLGPVTQIEFVSPTQLRSIALDRSIRLWDIQPVTSLQFLQGHTDEVRAVAYSPNGTLLASASKDKTIRIWDTANKKSLQTLTGHQGTVLSVAWHPKGTALVSGGEDKQVSIWTYPAGQRTQLPDSHQAPVVSVEYSPDASWIISTSSDGHMRMWSLAQQQLLREWKGPAGVDVLSAALSRGGEVLATAHKDGYVRFWNTADGKLRREEKRHTGAVNSVAFDYQSYLFTSGGDDNLVLLWTASNYAYSRGLSGSTEDITQVTFSPDGEWIAAARANHSVWLWAWRDSHVKHEISGHSGRIHGLSFHPTGQWLASASADHSIGLWNLPTQPLVSTTFLTPYSGTLGLAHDHTQGLLSVSGDNTYILLFGAQNRTAYSTIYGHAGRIRSLAYHPTKNWLFSASDDRTVRLWQTETSGTTTLRSWPAHQQEITDMVLTQKGNLLVTGSNDQTAKVWQLEPENKTPPQLLDILAHGGQILQLQASDDGQWLLSWASDHMVRLWNLQTGQNKRTFHISKPIAGIAMRPDGKQLVIASTDGTLHVWLTQEEAELPNLTVKLSSQPLVLRYDPKNQWLAVALEKQQIALLDASCYRQLQSYPLAYGEAQVLHWSLDASWLFVGDRNGGVSTWWCPDCIP